MRREDFEQLVLDTYGVRADYPFSEDFVTGVFRHASGKWFAIAMQIAERKLKGDSDRTIDVVNLKCAPEVIESLVGTEAGVYAAYHMNKMHWLTLSLAECDADTLAWLLGISYELTKKTRRAKSTVKKAKAQRERSKT